MKSSRHRRYLALGCVASLALLGACGSDDSGDDTSSDDRLQLRVFSFEPGTDQASFDMLDERIAQFEEENPDIEVIPEEYKWDPASFAAQLAGGTLPDVFQFPFTDGRTLAADGQLANLDALVAELPYADEFNPNVLDAGRGPDGDVYAIPVDAYGLGLMYNRALFEEAGLDPDAPPTSWDEVRDYAAQIAEATGQAGYAQMGQSGTGGWQLTAATYARGGLMEEVAADGTVTSTVDGDATADALQFLHDLRWEANALGSNVLFDWGTINQAFAAGQVGMYTTGADVYNALVQVNAIDPEIFGMTVVPTEGSGGVLGGGNLAGVPATASDEVQAAAVKWIDFYLLGKYTSEEAAVADAKTRAETDQPVGTPGLPLFSDELLDQYNEWIAEYVNVPLDQMTGFTSQIGDQKVITEPTGATQEVYAALDTAVQAVLTDQSADIPALLSQAQTDAQAAVDRS